LPVTYNGGIAVKKWLAILITTFAGAGLAGGATLQFGQLAVLSVNNHLGDLVQPVVATQLSGLDAAGFSQWVQQSKAMKPEAKTRLLETLKPALANKYFKAIRVKGAKYKTTGLATDIALVKIPSAAKTGDLAVDLFIAFEAPNTDGPVMQEKCGYYKCDRVGSPSCVHATRFQARCPPDQCQNDSECGTSDNAIDIFTTQ
jgi:hypothetical protein